MRRLTWATSSSDNSSRGLWQASCEGVRGARSHVGDAMVSAGGCGEWRGEGEWMEAAGSGGGRSRGRERERGRGKRRVEPGRGDNCAAGWASAAGVVMVEQQQCEGLGSWRAGQAC